MSDVGLEAARMEWAEAPRRIRRLRARLNERDNAAVDRAERAVSAEILRRTGPSYRLADLYAVYVDADRWARDVVGDELQPLRLPAAVTPLVDAAFHRAALAALDGR